MASQMNAPRPATGLARLVQWRRRREAVTRSREGSSVFVGRANVSCDIPARHIPSRVLRMAPNPVSRTRTSERPVAAMTRKDAMALA